MLIKTPVSGGWFVYQTDTLLAAPFRLCFNAAEPEGHIPFISFHRTNWIVIFQGNKVNSGKFLLKSSSVAASIQTVP